MLKKICFSIIIVIPFMISIAGQTSKTDQQINNQSFPAELTNPLLTNKYLSGARPFSRRENLNIYVFAGKPFRAEINARQVADKSDGTKIISEYHGILVRDSVGRVMSEQMPSPQIPEADGRSATFLAHTVNIIDPLTKIETNWSEFPKIANETPQRPLYSKPPLDRCETDQANNNTANSNNSNGVSQRSEKLGQRIIQGILTRGCRVYTSFPANEKINKSAFTMVDESWTSSDLGIALLQIHHDPTTEDQIIQFDNIVLSEPITVNFQPPADYRIIDPKGDDLPTEALNKEKLLHPEMFRIPIAIEHKNGSILMKIEDTRPMLIAVDFFRLKYGWRIDFEEPQFTAAEIIKLNAPQRYLFQSEYLENLAEPTKPDGEKQILEQVVADYNKSDNPGKFAVRQESNGRFRVVGIAVKDTDGKKKVIDPILDTLITIPVEQRNAEETIAVILDELSRQTGTKLSHGGIVENGLLQKKVTVGGEKISARTLLLQTLAGDWSLLYSEIQGGSYWFNTSGHWMKSAPQ